MDNTTYTEDEIVVSLKQKDKYVFDYLYSHYAGILFGIINKVVTDNHTAEDVLQEVFMKVWDKIGQYDQSKGRLFTWMVTIARNTAKDKLRSKEELMKQRHCAEEALMIMPAKTYRTDSIGIKGFVMKLRPECQIIIELVYFQGYTITDIASLLYLPEGTVKTRVREGLRTLKKTYNAHQAAVA